ncbi:MAG TPA: zf-HC2 domain-containing protein, partial [Gemmatirosa sp.]
MSDFGAATPHEEPSDAAHAAVRDALPALLHGRVTTSARAELDAHLARCAECEAEYRTLAAIRELYATPAPAISVDRIAAAVRARTAAPATIVSPAIAPPAIAPPAVVRATPVPPRRAPAWA